MADDVEDATFGDFTFAASIGVCPFDAASLDTIVLDRDAENAHVTYHCGTTRNIGVDHILRLEQSNGCALNQLHILRDLDEPGLRRDLEAAQQEKGLLIEQKTVLEEEVANLQAQLAILQGTASRPTGFVLTFGTPVAKGTP